MVSEEDSSDKTALLPSEEESEEQGPATQEKATKTTWLDRFLFRRVVAKVLKKPVSAIRLKKPGSDDKKKTPKTTTATEKPSLLKRHIAWEFRNAYIFAPLLIVFFLPRLLGQSYADYFLTHLSLAVIVLVPFIQVTIYTVRNYSRTHPPKTKSGKPKRPPLPALPKTSQYVRDTTDIMGNLDLLPWRLFYAIGFLAIVLLAGIWSTLSIDTFTNLQGPGQEEAIREIIAGLVVPLLYYGISIYRTQSIINSRQDAVGAVYAIARDTLGYPKANARTTTPRATKLKNPNEAIEVKKWRALYEIDEFFAVAPEELSVEDVKKWDEFSVNINAKMPRSEEWRIQRDPRGRGAKVGPANYPTGVLWDGEIDPDPLTFIIGQNLESGKKQYLTLNEASPHVAVSGATSSGKTSLAEIMAAQVLIKSMPWDPDLYGMVVVVDPKGPFARRWAGRPGVVAVNGQEDAAEPDDDGNPITGPVVMASGLEWVEEEHQRRASVLSRYKDVATWVHLPDEEKRKERFFPILVILDEYLDHTDLESANGDERVEKENFARTVIMRLTGWHARKYRNVGMHTVLIAQEVKMTAIGSALMRNLPVRAITGQMDDSQLYTMFGRKAEEIPSLPSTRYVFEDGEKKAKTIPGRARIMNALGQDIEKVQISWFGGKNNSETLDKWLPRGEAPPNGDFSLPPGKPRKRSDFDEEGNYIGADAAPVQDAMSDLPDEDAPTPPAAPAPIGLEAEETFPDEWNASEGASSTSDDTFPAAQAEDFPTDATPQAPSCTQDGCENDAKTECSRCNNPTCAEHLNRLASMKASERFCPACRASHPLVKAGVEEVYSVMEQEVRPLKGFSASFQTRQEDGAVSAIITIPTGQKLIEVRGVPGQDVASRSRSAQNSGVDDVIEHVRDVVNGYKKG